MGSFRKIYKQGGPCHGRGDHSWDDRSNVLIAGVTKQPRKGIDRWPKAGLDSGNVKPAGGNLLPEGGKLNDS
jgi:hypothetical protein